MRRVSIFLITSLMLTVVIGYAVAFWPLRDPHPAPAQAHGLLAITGARILVSPDGPAIDGGTVVLRDGRIAALGQAVEIPSGAEIIACNPGCVVTAGFWNAHVHFTQRKWSGAEWAPRARLETALEDMLTSRGFTTVVDLGSNLRDTVPLRRRIERGDLLGPKIYTAGAAQYPPNGIPFYLRATLPHWLILLMPQPKSPEVAARTERRNIADGADVLKLFTGSYVAPDRILPMPVANARAAVSVAHGAGQLAFAHESDLEGALVAMDAGVDVLAHAIDTTDGVDDAMLRNLITHRIAMIPTLKMFQTTVTTRASYLDPIYAQVRRFHSLAGDLLFGTDVGYMGDYTTAGEFEGLEKAGLTGSDMLRMLTTAPAARFGTGGETGTVEVGKAGDLVVLDRDPTADPAAFSQVRATIRNGRILCRHP